MVLVLQKTKIVVLVLVLARFFKKKKLVLVWVLVLKARLNSKEPKLETIANILLTLDFSVFSKTNFKIMVPILVLGLIFNFFKFFDFDSRIGSKN